MLCLWGVVPACDHFVARSWWPWWCLLTIRWRCGNCGASMAHVSGVEGMVPSSPSVVPSSRAQCAITAGHPPECLYHPTQRLISSHPVSTHPDSSTATWSPPHSQDQQFRCDQCDYILAWEERVPLDPHNPSTQLQIIFANSSDWVEQTKVFRVGIRLAQANGASNCCRIIFGRQSGTSFNLRDYIQVSFNLPLGIRAPSRLSTQLSIIASTCPHIWTDYNEHLIYPFTSSC